MVTIQQFRDAWADKPNRAAAFALAEQYVNENAATLEPILGDKDSDECVQLVSLARAAGNDDMATVVSMWELVTFERRQIGGALNVTAPVNFPVKRIRGGVA